MPLIAKIIPSNFLPATSHFETQCLEAKSSSRKTPTEITRLITTLWLRRGSTAKHKDGCHRDLLAMIELSEPLASG